MKSVIKRILGTIPVLIGVVLLIFIMLRIVPGNAAAMLLGEHVDQATIDRLTEVMGLDKPVIVQFFDYLAGAIHGDLGISYKYNRAVTDMIIEAFPYTLELALLAALFAWVLGLGTGIIAAIRQNSLVDHLFMGVSLAGVSMPIFMAALLLQYGQEPEESCREIAPILAKNLTKSQIMRTIELLQKYRGECTYNVGTGHVLGAIAVELEGIL